MSRIGIEMPVHQIHRDREKAAFRPFHFVLPLALGERRVSPAGQYVNDLLVKVMPLDESLAFGNLPDRGIHMNIAGEVQIDAASPDLGPGLNLLSFRIED